MPNSNYITTCSDSISTSYVWVNWNQEYTASASATTTATFTVTTSGNDTTWVVWNDMYATTGSASGVMSNVYNQENPEAIRRRVEEANARRAEEAERAAKAQSRALRLLQMTLSQKQRRQFEEHQFFEVLAHNGTVRYLLARGRSANVYRLDDKGKPVKRFCVHPGVMCPDEDTLIAQKLMLETNPAEFERIANSHPIDERGHRLARLAVAA